jgi:hypothetical protein
MASLWQGAHTWWAFTREEPVEQAIRRMLEEWVAGGEMTVVGPERKEIEAAGRQTMGC